MRESVNNRFPWYECSGKENANFCGKALINPILNSLKKAWGWFRNHFIRKANGLKSYNTPGCLSGVGTNDYFISLMLLIKFAKNSVPKKGDIISIDDSTNWRYLLPIVLSDGHKASLVSGDKQFTFTLIDPNDVFRRKGKRNVYSQYFPQGKFINPWSWSLRDSDFQFLQIDGIPVPEWKEYIVEQDYYWAMGDNRDDSLDSRFWGFIPFDKAEASTIAKDLRPLIDEDFVWIAEIDSTPMAFAVSLPNLNEAIADLLSLIHI